MLCRPSLYEEQKATIPFCSELLTKPAFKYFTDLLNILSEININSTQANINFSIYSIEQLITKIKNQKTIAKPDIDLLLIYTNDALTYINLFKQLNKNNS
jgi:hypothetical protein